jgi:hypothetical protein
LQTFKAETTAGVFEMGVGHRSIGKGSTFGARMGDAHLIQESHVEV